MALTAVDHVTVPTEQTVTQLQDSVHVSPDTLATLVKTVRRTQNIMILVLKITEIVHGMGDTCLC